MTFIIGTARVTSSLCALSEAAEMTGSKRVRREVGKLSHSGTLGIAGLVLILGGGLSWAAGVTQMPPIQSDANNNTAGGTGALSSNTTGTENTAFGASTLQGNMTGDYNTAFGDQTLVFNTIGNNNTALGRYALVFNATNNNNTALGSMALYSNAGDNNTATGASALQQSAGDSNTATGAAALNTNVSGNNNTAVGVFALSTNSNGSNNTAIGYNADVMAGNYTDSTALGYNAKVPASNSIVLGDGFIKTIYAQVTTIMGISDRRRKKDIKALDSDLGLDFIQKLQPVSYRYNNGDDTERYGFIAQDLEQALPVFLREAVETPKHEHGLALIERGNDKDRTYRVAYGELIAPMVKAIQEQQHEITTERQQNADLRRALEDQAAAFKAELHHALQDQAAAFKAELHHALQDQAAAFKAEQDALRCSIRPPLETINAAR
jgi:trimeric autotransporter adhesin